jgi:hypothetical protein
VDKNAARVIFSADNLERSEHADDRTPEVVVEMHTAVAFVLGWAIRYERFFVNVRREHSSIAGQHG